MVKFKGIHQAEKIFLFILVIYALLSTNITLTLVAVTVPFLFYILLWKENESPFLFLAAMLQWLSITIKLFYCNLKGIEFNESFENYKNIIPAYYYSIIGLISVSIGVHLIIRKFEINGPDYKNLALNYDSRKIVPIYMIIAIIFPIMSNYSFALGGLQQPIYKLADFKWMFFFIFMLSCLYTKQFKLFFIICFFEIIMSLTGFFSGFKDYFLVLFGGILIVYWKNLKFKSLFPLLFLVIVCLSMVIIWTSIKQEYRSYLSGGQTTQNVTKGTGESLNKLSNLLETINGNTIEDGFKATIDRLSYIDFFSATIEFVPKNIPHTHGRLWGDAVGRVLQPRLFFPNKTAIDDSETTSKYSGIQVSGADQGTSISLGYMTENYIDFGVPVMFISLLIYGLIIGSVYKYVMLSSPNKLVGTAMIIPLFILIYLFESALNKLIGGLFMYLIIYELIRRFALEKILNQIKV